MPPVDYGVTRVNVVDYRKSSNKCWVSNKHLGSEVCVLINAGSRINIGLLQQH